MFMVDELSAGDELSYRPVDMDIFSVAREIIDLVFDVGGGFYNFIFLYFDDQVRGSAAFACIKYRDKRPKEWHFYEKMSLWQPLIHFSIHHHMSCLQLNIYKITRPIF